MEWQRKRKELVIPWSAKLLISVGELSKRKNHKIVVQALQELPDDYWYIIVGQGDLKEELEQLDKTGRLKLLGYRTDIPDLLRCSDLFIFPSLQEGLPVALMEAMSVGVACIASRIRGNVDLLIKDSLVCDKDKADEWLKKIKSKELKQPSLAEEFHKDKIEEKIITLL